MDCDDCAKRLNAFLDTELSESEIASVRSHLDGCEGCDDNFVFEERFLAQLKDCCTSDVAPAELRQRVILKLRGESPPPPTR
jgi:mycothiol system anti-sigma-R factor